MSSRDLSTGVGFIGGGAILKHEHAVRGTVTAASLWAIGTAVGIGAYDVAVIVCVLTFATLTLLKPLKRDGGGGRWSRSILIPCQPWKPA